MTWQCRTIQNISALLHYVLDHRDPGMLLELFQQGGQGEPSDFIGMVMLGKITRVQKRLNYVWEIMTAFNNNLLWIKNMTNFIRNTKSILFRLLWHGVIKAKKQLHHFPITKYSVVLEVILLFLQFLAKIFTNSSRFSDFAWLHSMLLKISWSHSLSFAIVDLGQVFISVR